MGVLDDVFSVLRKPRDVFVGGVTGLGKQLSNATNIPLDQSLLQTIGLQDKPEDSDVDELNQIFKDLDNAGVDTSEWEHLRPRGQSFLSGVKEGWEGDVSPARLISQNRDVESWDDPQSTGGKILSTGMDVAVDPLNMLGAGALGKIPGLAKVAEGAGTFGKLEKGTDIGTRLGAYGRRALQGTMATGDPLTGVLASPLIGVGEQAVKSGIAKAAGSRLAKLGSKYVDEIGSRRDQKNFARIRGDNVDEGQLIDDSRYVVSPADAGDVGAAVNPVKWNEELPSLPLDYTGANEPLSRTLSSMLGDMPSGQLALPRAGTTSRGVSPANPIEAGPIGTTGLAQPNEELLNILRGELPFLSTPKRGLNTGKPMGGPNIEMTAEEALMELYNAQPKALPRASAIPLGNDRQQMFLQAIQEELRRMRGAT